MGLLNYLGGRGSSAGEEGSSRHFESDVGGVTVGGVALEEEKSWEQPDPSVTLAMPVAMVYTLGGSALQTTLNTLAVVFLLEIDDLLYNAVIDARYKRYARRHRFRLRWFDYHLLDAKRFTVIFVCMSCMVILITPPARDFARRAVGLFVAVMICIGFLDTLADPEEGRRVLASCGVKSPSRLRSTLTALLIWAVMVLAVRALALATFVYITRFNVEDRATKI